MNSIQPTPITSRVSGAVGHSDLVGDGGMSDDTIPRWKDQWLEQPVSMADNGEGVLFAWMWMVPVLVLAGDATRSCERLLW